jgi:hypothetical protein
MAEFLVGEARLLLLMLLVLRDKLYPVWTLVVTVTTLDPEAKPSLAKGFSESCTLPSPSLPPLTSIVILAAPTKPRLEVPKAGLTNEGTMTETKNKERKENRAV